ncbi:hypothetical protein [Chromatium okenii]|jgi:hypothetical protein|uniref:hypothetical protein n=1 Tax=Chromatium okenii TaxID=61644 RepID=UPI001559AB5E|nr:hypothetical protein [Chromatium okenii]MBV5309313.1 hypothetical protein [Chromatium okenii]
MNKEDISDEFRIAGDLYSALVARGLGQTPEALQAFARMIDAAPQSFLDMMHNKVVEMGLIPDKPDGYTSDGEPVYRLDAVATRLGISQAEAEESLRDFQNETGAQFLKGDDVHSVQ